MLTQLWEFMEIAYEFIIIIQTYVGFLKLFTSMGLF